MVSKHKLSHDDTAVRVELPQHLDIKTMDGSVKTGTILVDDAMVDIIQALWNKYKIGTVGCCKGYTNKKLSGLPWIQIGSNVDYPDWGVNLIVSERLVEAQGYSPDDMDMDYMTTTIFIDKSIKNKSVLRVLVEIVISALVLYITLKFLKI